MVRLWPREFSGERLATRARALPWWFLGFLIAIAMPAGNLMIFSGVPFTSLLEIAAVAALVPLAFSRDLRRSYLSWMALRSCRPGVASSVVRRSTMGVLVAAAIVVKIVLLAAAPEAGFRACYGPAPSAQGGGTGRPEPCARTFEREFFSNEITRFDQTIMFGTAGASSSHYVRSVFYQALVVTDGLAESNWNLAFVNSLRYNAPFYNFIPGALARSRFPLTGAWTGVIEIARSREILLSYTGKVAVTIDGELAYTDSKYSGVASKSISVTPGRHRIAVNYVFDDGYRYGSRPPPGPYANLHVLTAPTGGGGATIPLRAVEPAPTWRVLAGLGDLALGLIVGTVIVSYWRRFGIGRWILGVILLAGFMCILTGSNEPVPFCAAVAVLVGLLVDRHQIARAVAYCLAFWTSFYFSIIQLWDRVNSTSSVVYHAAGTDFLSYDSWARTIMEHRSLRAGEDVFYFQPGFRYILFFQRAFLGETTFFVLAIGMTSLMLGAFYFAYELTIHRTSRCRLGVALLCATLLILFQTADVSSLVALGASEYPTWCFLLVGMALLFCEASTARWIGGACFLGLCFNLRPNQLPGVVYLLLIFFVYVSKDERKRAILVTIPAFMAIALLPAVHNLIYGHELVFLPTNGDHPQNIVIHLREVAKLFSDPDVHNRFTSQLRRLVYMRPSAREIGEALGNAIAYSKSVEVVIRIIQISWILAVSAVVARWKRTTTVSKLMLLLPISFLAPHIFIHVVFYFPRHIMVGYVAMAASVMYVVCDSERSWVPLDVGVSKTQPSDGDLTEAGLEMKVVVDS